MLIDEVRGNVLFAGDLLGLIRVSDEYLTKHQPHAGGYYVIYADGYESFSRAEAFEQWLHADLAR